MYKKHSSIFKSQNTKNLPSFLQGITTNLIGATLVDLRYIYSASLNAIAYLPIAYGLGYLLGSQAPLLFRLVPRQLLLLLALLICAATTALMPHYGSLQVTLAMLVLNGVCSSAWDSSVILWLVEMWPSPPEAGGGNSPVIHGGNSAYGAGAIAAPLLVSSYVFGEANFTTLISSDHHQEIIPLTAAYRIASLSTPFAVAGALQAVVPCFFFIFYFVRRYRYPETAHSGSSRKPAINYQLVVNEAEDEEDEDETSDEADDKVDGKKLIIEKDKTEIEKNHHHHRKALISHRRTKIYLCGLMLSCYATARIGHFNFSTALLQHLPGLSVDAATAAHVLSILSAAYMTGRLTSALISFKLSPDALLTIHLSILLTAISVLTFGRDDLQRITVGTALIGYGFSGMWGSCFAFTARHLKLTASVCSLYTLLSGSLSLVVPLVMGRSFESNPVLFFYMEYGFIVCCASLFITLKLWIAADEGGGGGGGGHKWRWGSWWWQRSASGGSVKYSYVQ